MTALETSKKKRAFMRMNPAGFRQANARSPGIVLLPDGTKVRVKARKRFFVTPFKKQVTGNPMVVAGTVKYMTVVLPATYGDETPANVGLNGAWVKLSPGGGMGILHRGKRRDPVSVLQVKQDPFGTMRAKVRYVKHDRRGEGHSGNPGNRVRRTVSTASRPTNKPGRGPGSRAHLYIWPDDHIGPTPHPPPPPPPPPPKKNPPSGGIGQVLRDLGSGRARLRFSRTRGVEVVKR